MYILIYGCYDAAGYDDDDDAVGALLGSAKVGVCTRYRVPSSPH